VLRVVLDANVLISGLIGREDRAPRQLLDAWREARFELVVSPLLLAELRRVLAYPKLERWAGEDRGLAWIAGVTDRATLLADPGGPPIGFQDPKDEYLIALGRSADVDYLVSGDGPIQQIEVDGLCVITPRAFIDELNRR
jgi:putative PIN family toxin of toxin-antitoxin system